MQSGFEYFEHTADIGMRIAGTKLEELFVQAGLGVTKLLVPEPELLKADQERRVEFSNAELDYLLFDYLSELVYLFESEGFIGADYEVTINGSDLVCVIHGDTFNPTIHPSGNELKAVTYHGLFVKSAPTGWLAEVIFDI